MMIAAGEVCACRVGGGSGWRRGWIGWELVGKQWKM